MSEVLIKLQNIGFEYNQNKNILKNISLEVSKGEMISLIGLNGAGKTTLLKIMAGLIKPTVGTITTFTNKISYVPQTHDIDTSFPISVHELGRLFGGDKFNHFVEQVQMTAFLNSSLSKLSGGQFQRVMIAVALSNNPNLLLLDEPVSGIDVAGETSFYKLINDIRTKNNLAIILVSHDIHLVFKESEKIICLAHHVCCEGNPEEIYKSDDFRKAFGPYLKPYIHHHDHNHL